MKSAASLKTSMSFLAFIAAMAPSALIGAQPASAQPTASAVASPADFADVFQRVAPAVVSIEVVTHLPGAQDTDRIPFPFMPQFQGRSGSGGRLQGGGKGGKAAPSQPDDDGDNKGPEAQAAGSGFLISSDGYIVTNNHVVEGATKITVTLADKRSLPAKVIGRDEATDLAVIKIDGSGFNKVEFETRMKPRVGNWVMAVGNPLQLGGTATAGIVSYVGRDLNEARSTFIDYLQISAPITFGNSGGPTFDVYGRVIGVNAAIYSENGGGGGGIGFAIPADLADKITRQLMTGKTIVRGYLGATIENLDRDSAEALGLQQTTGAQIADLVPGGPGDKAGLRPGDVVLSINGEKVASSSALTRAVAQTPAGENFQLGVQRAGQTEVITVRAGVRPTQAKMDAQATGGGRDDADGGAAGSAQSVELGLKVSDLTSALRKAATIGPNVVGVIIVDVESGSDAERKGLNAGDVVEQVNQNPVTNRSDFSKTIAQARRSGRESVLLLVNRAGRNIALPIKLAVGR